ncbi:hypothetical protein ACSSS7_001563 [Eimeria intestinalis]
MGGAASSRGNRPNGDGSHQQQRQQQAQQQQQRHQQQQQEHQERQYQQQQEEHQRRHYQQLHQLQEQRQHERQRQHQQLRQQVQQQARQRQTGVVESREWDGLLTLAPGASTQQPPRSTSRSRGMGEEPPLGLFFSSAPPRMNTTPKLFVEDEFAGLDFSYEELFEAFLLLDLNAAQAEHSAHAALRCLHKLHSKGSSNSSSSSSSKNTAEAPEATRDEGEEALLRFATGRRKVQRMQEMLAQAEQTNEVPLETQEDWEDLAGSFLGSFYCISRTFWKSQGAVVATGSGGSSSSSSGSGSSSTSSCSSSLQDGANGFPIDLESASRFYSRLVYAARKVEGRVEATSVLLKSIEAFCVLLLARAKALQYPHQLAFIPILLGQPVLEPLTPRRVLAVYHLVCIGGGEFGGRRKCPFLEDDVQLGALARLCELVAALPFGSRCILVKWRACVPSLLLLLLLHLSSSFLGAYCPSDCCSRSCCVEYQLRLRRVGWLGAAVRLLTAPPLESWRSPRATSPFSEAALRSALELLHLLYTANVRRQQQRLLLKNWRRQDVPTVAEDAFEGDDLCPGASEQQQQQQKLQKLQQREIEFEAFHNDAINSSQQLLQFEFAMWIRVRRSGFLNRSAQQGILRRRGMPSIQPIVTEHFPRPQQDQPPQHDQQPQQHQQQQQQLGAEESPTAGGARQADGGEGGFTGSIPAGDTPATEGRGTQNEGGSGARPVSANSLFSARAEADAALEGLSDSDEGAEVIFIPEPGQTETAEEIGSSSQLYGSDSLQSHLMRVLETVREPRDPGTPAGLGAPDRSSASAARAAAAAALPNFPAGSSPELPASTAAAAAALAANMPFNHSAVPGAGGRGHRTFFTVVAHPFVLDASSKAEILRREAAVEQQMQARHSEVEALFSLCTGGVGYPLPFLYLRVRRSHLLQDTLQQIASNSSTGGRSRNSNLRKALKVKFIGEEGVDQGGVAKEFFQLLVDEACEQAVGVGLLLCAQESALRAQGVGRGSRRHAPHVQRLHGLLGRTEGDPSGVARPQRESHCAEPVSSEVQPQPAQVEDSMLQQEGESDTQQQQQQNQREEAESMVRLLCVCGRREEFIELYLQHVLNTSVESQYSAFESGFYRCVDRAAVSLFRPEELQLLLLGKEEELDVALLQKAAAYDDGYTAESPAVGMFWRVCSRLNQEQKKCLLMFITGTSRLNAHAGRLLPVQPPLPAADVCSWCVWLALAAGCGCCCFFVLFKPPLSKPAAALGDNSRQTASEQ